MSKYMVSTLTFEHIQSTIKALPIQSRIMLRLLLLQYLNLEQEDIDFMAADQPDSRMLSGDQPKERIVSHEAIQNISDRATQYRRFLRQKRERPGLQILCLKKLLVLTDQTIQVAERILTSTFKVDEAILQHHKQQAFTSLIKQAQRKLDRAWQQQALLEPDYQKERLLIELQRLLRKREQYRKRLASCQRDFVLASHAPLQNHEIAHIWGIPLGSLAARKVKAFNHYFTDVQKIIPTEMLVLPQENQASQANRPDYWKESMAILSRRPIERSILAYDGLERNEETLMERLGSFVAGTMAEEEESRFWITITKIHDSEHGGMWHSQERSIFALQRLFAILEEFDQSEEALEDALHARITPLKPGEQLPAPEPKDEPMELSETALGVLQAFVGEQDDKRRT